MDRSKTGIAPTRRQFMATAAAAAAATFGGSVDASQEEPGYATATAGVRAAMPLAAKDPERPSYHFGPPAQWNNDPNGTLFYKGWHHLFYQLNPYGTTGANQHWGHARSRDLVNWEHLPIAIGPSLDKGERYIYSGGAALAADGRPRMLYTSIGHPDPEQWLAIPEDDELVRWAKFAGNPVLAMGAHNGVKVEQWRDPFMFVEGGRSYMVCGGSTRTPRRGGGGQVHLYRAENGDLTAWKYLGVVFQALERETFNIECPNLFKLDGQWVLITSPHRACEYYVGSLDLEACRFTPETHGILDPGDAYASNISVDDRGRTILWLWGRTQTPPGRGWNGTMVLPRVLSIGPDGALRQQVAPEFEALRGPVKSFGELSLGGDAVPLEGISGKAVEIEAEFAVSGFASFGFELRPSASEAASTVVSLQRGSITVGRARAYIGGGTERLKVRLFLDGRCLEVYANDGAAAVYAALDAAPATRSIAVFARTGRSDFSPPGSGPPPVKLVSLRAWPMKPASFSLDRFQ